MKTPAIIIIKGVRTTQETTVLNDALRTIEKISNELSELRLVLMKNGATSDIYIKKTEKPVKQPKIDLQSILEVYGLPNDDVKLINDLHTIIEHKHLTETEVKQILKRVSNYKSKQNINNVGGYIISCFRKAKE